MSEQAHVGNPLTLMAIFAGLSEAVGAAVLPFLATPQQIYLTFFVIFFPTSLMFLFFLTLWISPARLYGPGDFRSEESLRSWLSAMLSPRQVRRERITTDATSDALYNFLYPAGKESMENRKRLEQWLRDNNIDVRAAVFVAGAAHAHDRKRAASALGLTGI